MFSSSQDSLSSFLLNRWKAITWCNEWEIYLYTCMCVCIYNYIKIYINNWATCYFIITLDEIITLHRWIASYDSSQQFPSLYRIFYQVNLLNLLIICISNCACHILWSVGKCTKLLSDMYWTLYWLYTGGQAEKVRRIWSKNRATGYWQVACKNIGLFNTIWIKPV